ncbi:MAG TPA: CHAP domain-containing protein [Patescibacteria group bacterium]|nr:CHAP domain-containing protein [Patescibacteria group bacterium]
MSTEFSVPSEQLLTVPENVSSTVALRTRLGRASAALLLTAGAALAAFSVEEAIEPSAAYATVTTTANGLSYPWKDAPCEFGTAGGASCQNTDPNKPADKYDWYIDEDGDGAFGTAGPPHNTTGCGSTGANGECFDERGYEYRNCTSYVGWRLHALGVENSQLANLGNGGEWYDKSPASKRSTVAKAGDAAVKPTSNTDAFGHVAFVESVNSVDTSNHANDNITVSEYNHDAHGNGDYRTGTVAELGFTEFVDFGVTPEGTTSGGAATLARPAAISFNGALNVFIRGGDGQIYNQYWNGTSWTGYSSIGGNMASDPAVIINGGALNVFARGADGQIYTKYNDGTNWTGWSSMGTQTMKGNPRVVQYGTETDVFALGTDNHPYKVTKQSGGNWGAWSSLGDYMDSSPSPVVYGTELDVIMRGGDNAVYKDTWNGTGWGGFSSLGCCLAGNPDVIAYGGQLTIWANAPGNHIWKRTWNGSAWGNWEDFAGTLNGDPDAVQYGNDMELFARGGDGQMYTRFWSASGNYWSGWASTDTAHTVAGDPTAIQYGSELDVFATGADGKTYKNTWNGSSWGGFTPLPG